jgi:hypothetical protein
MLKKRALWYLEADLKSEQFRFDRLEVLNKFPILNVPHCEPRGCMTGERFRQVQVGDDLLRLWPRCKDPPKIQFVLLGNEVKDVLAAVIGKLAYICAETCIRRNNHCSIKHATSWRCGVANVPIMAN